jgi:hypothetical protein
VEKEAYVCPLFSILVLVLELLSSLHCSCAKAAAFPTTSMDMVEAASPHYKVFYQNQRRKSVAIGRKMVVIVLSLPYYFG